MPCCLGGVFVFRCRATTAAVMHTEPKRLPAVLGKWDILYCTYTRFTFSQIPWRSHYKPAELKAYTTTHHSGFKTAVPVAQTGADRWIGSSVRPLVNSRKKWEPVAAAEAMLLVFLSSSRSICNQPFQLALTRELFRPKRTLQRTGPCFHGNCAGEKRGGGRAHWCKCKRVCLHGCLRVQEYVWDCSSELFLTLCFYLRTASLAPVRRHLSTAVTSPSYAFPLVHRDYSYSYALQRGFLFVSIPRTAALDFTPNMRTERQYDFVFDL